MPLGLESPGFESLTLSGCVSWSEVLREFPCSISPVELVIPSSKWMAPDKCLMDTAALTRQPPALPLTSSPETSREGTSPWSRCITAIMEMDFQRVVGKGSWAEQSLLRERSPTPRSYRVVWG